MGGEVTVMSAVCVCVCVTWQRVSRGLGLDDVVSRCSHAAGSGITGDSGHMVSLNSSLCVFYSIKYTVIKIKVLSVRRAAAVSKLETGS